MATVLKQEPDSREIAAVVPEPPKSGKKKIVLPIVAIIVALGLLWAFKQWSYGRGHESTDDAAVDGHLVPVLAKVSGYVQAVNASDNDHVKADSLLVQIDPTEYRVKLQQAEADLAAAQAAAGSAGGASGQARAAVDQATGQRAALDAQITAAKANEVKARQDLARMEELAGKQIVSKMQLDAARAAAEAASANVVALQRQTTAAGGTIASAHAGVTSAQAGIRLADARLAGAKAARDNAQLQLNYTRVLAPASGILSRKQVEPGQLVQAGQPLATIVTDTGVFVTANFKETQLGDIKVGQPAEVEVDAYGGATAHGCVESLSAATGSKFALLPPDNATGNFTKVVQRVPVRVKVTQDLGGGRALRPGMSVTVHVDTKAAPGKC